MASAPLCKTTKSSLVERGLKEFWGGARTAARVLVAVTCGFLLSSCASTPPSLDPATKLPDGQGVVLGRAVTTFNGSPTQLPKELIMMHVSPYLGDDELARNYYAAGKWALRTGTSSDGYFMSILPAGKYYFVEFDYLYSSLGRMIGFRSYMNIPSATAHRPSVWTFEVLPGKVTYIGTMKHNFSDVVSGPLDRGSIDVELVDQTDIVKLWYSTRESQYLEFETRLAGTHQLP